MKFKTIYNSTPDKGEKVSKKSMTIPDMSMSIKEIMRRHASGLPISGERVPIYQEEEMPNLQKLDISELHQLKKQTDEEIQDIQEELRAADLAKAKEEENARIEAEVQKRLKAQGTA